MRVWKSVTPWVLFTSFAFSASAADVDRSFHQRFDVEPGARLELDHEDGEVRITPWEEDAIEVNVSYRVEFRRVGLGSDPDLDVSFDQRGDVVRVIGKEKSSGGVGFFSSNTIEYVYRVSAPAWVTLDLRGEDGDVEIEGWKGEIILQNEDGDVRLSELQVPSLRLEVQDGDVDIEDAEGEMELEVEDGDVTMRDCRGRRIRVDGQDGNIRLERCQSDFDLSTEDGDIDLAGLQAGQLEVRTSDGRIEVELETSAEELDVDLSTEDGDVELRLGSEIAGSFTLSSDDGDIRVDAETRSLDEDEYRVSGRLGEGAGQIRVSTDSGRITLRQ